jgi:hypothetical protein
MESAAPAARVDDDNQSSTLTVPMAVVPANAGDGSGAQGGDPTSEIEMSSVETGVVQPSVEDGELDSQH